MPVGYPGLFFDQEGVCSLCRNHEIREPLGEKAFVEILDSRKGREYDCIVGVSGGKDSSYVAYLAKKKYGLRVLAVCYDFPFLRDLARRNVRNVCESLKIDLVTVAARGNLEYRLLKNHLISVAATGTTWGQCLFCHYGISAILYNMAVQKGVPFILGGITKYELWNPGNRMHFLFRRLRRLSASEKIRFMKHQGKAYSLLVEQRKQFPIPKNSRFDVYRRTILPNDGPRSLEVFEYLPWDQRGIEKTLMEETRWVRPEKTISWRYDCVLEPFLDYTYKKEFGISTVGIYTSHLIRDGKMSREAGLEVLVETEREELKREKLEPVLEYFGLPSHVKERFFDAE